MASPQLVTPSSDAVISTLKWLRRQSFRPVPLRKGTKAAATEAYAGINYEPPADDFWASQDLGVGVVCGPRHSGPVDIDIDCGEAAFFASRFLPVTSAIFGRKTKPRSHYLYRLDGDCAKRAFLDPIQKGTIIEIRGDGGHQTVMPGSIHEKTGELIEWSEVPFPDVARSEYEVLDKAVKKVAIAVLIARHLWIEGQRNEIVKHLAGLFYYLEWSEEEVKDFVRALMDYTDDDDVTRLKTVGITYRKGEKGGKITGANTLREILGPTQSGLVDKILEWAGSPFAAFLQDYNERFAVVAVEGKFRVAETQMMEKGAPPVFFQKDDFLNLMATDTIEVEDKPVPKAKIWLANPRRRQYKTVDFLPGEDDSSGVLNLWTGWAVNSSDEGSCKAWIELLRGVVCGGNEATYNWMLHWFANIVREPQSKPLTSPVMIGRQGAGKSLLFSYFGKILGSSYVVITNEEHIYGRFNKHLAHTLLLHSEEALYGGDRKHRGIIKSLITDEFRIFEQKGIDARRIRNHLRLALTSNDPWAAPAEADDRRFSIIDMDERKIEPELIKEVLHEMNNGGPSALFHHMLHMDYDPVVPKINIKNDALATLKQLNFDPVVGWWYDCLQRGTILPDYLSWAQDPQSADWPSCVSSSALHLSLILKCRENSQRLLTPAALAPQLNKMIGHKLVRTQKYFVNPMSDEAPREVRLLPAKHYTIMNMPPLEDCRKAFERRMGQKIEWYPEVKDDRPDYSRF